MLNFFRNLFRETPAKAPTDFVVFCRRYTVPPNKQPVFSQFVVPAKNIYDAARKFDQNYTAWTRLTVYVPYESRNLD